MHARNIIRLNNDDHRRHAPWRYLLSMVLFVAEKSPQNAPSTREVSIFLTEHPPQISKNLLIEKFPYLYGERFFKYYIDRYVYN